MASDKGKQKIEMQERYKFFARLKKNNESLEDFITNLKEMAKFCNFGQQKEKMIRDMVIQNIKDEVLLKLVLEEELNLDNLKHTCNAFNRGTKREDFSEKIIPKEETKSEKTGTNSGSVINKFKKPCWKCKNHHSYGECPGLKCNYCKQLGHLLRSCPKLSQPGNNYPTYPSTDEQFCKFYTKQKSISQSDHLVKNPNQFSSRINLEKQTSSSVNLHSKDLLPPITTGIIPPSAPPAAIMDFSIEEDLKIKTKFEINRNKTVEASKKKEEINSNYQISGPKNSSATFYPKLSSIDLINFIPQNSQNNVKSNVKDGISHYGPPKVKRAKQKKKSNMGCSLA